MVFVAKWKVVLWVVNLVVLVFAVNMAASVFVPMFSEPIPEELLLERAAELSGWKKEEFRIRKAGYGSKLLRYYSYLELQPKGQHKVLYIEMERPLYILEWQLSEYRVMSKLNGTKKRENH